MARKAPGIGRAVFRRAEAVADAIMYEGYLLYPYRRSSVKNQVRWQFGVLAPKAWAEAHAPCHRGVAGSAECWWQQTECLVEATGDTTILARVRFLQLQRKSVRKRLPAGGFRRVSELRAGRRWELSFDEAVPRCFDVSVSLGALPPEGQQFRLHVPGGRESERLTDEQGNVAGLVVRRRWPVTARVSVSAQPVPGRAGLHRLRLRVGNAGATAGPEATREVALRHALLATHSLLAANGGSFLSLLDPPQWARDASRACSNVHTFPVLVGTSAGAPDRDDLVLSAPIILPDHPRVAPESPWDLHDATEIDELLALRTLTLTEQEKHEARATDGRAAAIVDRVEAMPSEVLARLHGAIRSLAPAEGAGPAAASPATPPPAAAAPAESRPTVQSGLPDQPHQESGVPWWDPGADSAVSPATDSIVIGGTRVAGGSRVRLVPHQHRADPHDMFLAGKTARVEAVLADVDGTQHLAVTLDGDPASDLNQWYGRFRYFAPEEVEPLPADGGGR